MILRKDAPERWYTVQIEYGELFPNENTPYKKYTKRVTVEYHVHAVNPIAAINEINALAEIPEQTQIFSVKAFYNI